MLGNDTNAGFMCKFNENSENDCFEVEEKNKIYVCNICGKSFYRKASLTTHISSHNFDTKSNDKIERQNTCNTCFKKFTAKKNLLKHLRDVHKNYSEADRMVVKKIKCPEMNCEFLCRMMKELRDHIEKHHKIKILKDLLQFPSESAFQKWKKEEECNTVSWFVTGRKKTTLMDGTRKQTLYCHRTGHYNPKGFGKYRMRSVGSCKIGVTCPAAMEVVESPDGEITVIYYKTHLGHVQDVVYLKLTQEERAQLADKIKQGFSFDAILEDVKESRDFDQQKKKRIHLLSKKDLYSIMRTANCTSRKGASKEQNEKSHTSGKNSVLHKNSLEIENMKLGPVEENLALYSSHSLTLQHKRDNNYEENPNFMSFQKRQRNADIPQTSNEGVTSQIVILSPDVECTSFAEIIFLSSADGSPQPAILSQAKLPGVGNHLIQKPESQIPTVSEVEEKKINKSNLHLQLKEKLQRISEFLPQSEHLTPKQFNLISAKLNGVLDIFQVADARANAKKQGSKKKVIKSRILRSNAGIESETKRIEFGIETERKIQGNYLGQELVYTVYK